MGQWARPPPKQASTPAEGRGQGGANEVQAGRDHENSPTHTPRSEGSDDDDDGRERRRSRSRRRHPSDSGQQDRRSDGGQDGLRGLGDDGVADGEWQARRDYEQARAEIMGSGGHGQGDGQVMQTGDGGSIRRAGETIRRPMATKSAPAAKKGGQLRLGGPAVPPPQNLHRTGVQSKAGPGDAPGEAGNDASLGDSWSAKPSGHAWSAETGAAWNGKAAGEAWSGNSAGSAWTDKPSGDKWSSSNWDWKEKW